MEITTDRCSGSLATGAGGPGTGSAGRGFGGAGLRSRVKATRQRESWPVHDAHEDRYPFPLTPSPPPPARFALAHARGPPRRSAPHPALRPRPRRHVQSCRSLASCRPSDARPPAFRVRLAGKA